MARTDRSDSYDSVLLYDAECEMCSAAVKHVERSGETTKGIRCVPLKSREGRDALKRAGAEEVADETMILIDEDGVHDRSTAVLRVATRIGGAWRFSKWAQLVPRRVRDGIYRLVARNRHRFPIRRRATQRRLDGTGSE